MEKQNEEKVPYYKTEKGKETARRYRNSEKGKEAAIRYRENKQAEKLAAEGKKYMECRVCGGKVKVSKMANTAIHKTCKKEEAKKLK